MDAAELGWDDLAHWHPYALRWSELDLICRAIAALDPQLPHPGAPLALLCRFAAVFEDDDVDQAGNLWARQDDDHEADFYSTRVEPAAGAEHFPYTRLRALLAAAATTLAPESS